MLPSSGVVVQPYEIRQLVGSAAHAELSPAPVTGMEESFDAVQRSERQRRTVDVKKPDQPTTEQQTGPGGAGHYVGGAVVAAGAVTDGMQLGVDLVCIVVAALLTLTVLQQVNHDGIRWRAVPKD